jgi:hypothetical protein
VKQRSKFLRGAVLATAAAGLVLLMAGCQSTESGPPAGISLMVYDQNLFFSGGYYEVSRVFTDGPSWLVIYNSANGAPNEIIGKEKVPAGLSRHVRVYVSINKRSETLFVKLHGDAGKIGEFEFPGPDEVIVVDGKEVAASFKDQSMNIQQRMN